MKQSERSEIANLVFKGLMPSDSEISRLSIKKSDLDAIKAEVSRFSGGYTLEMNLSLKELDPENKVIVAEERIRRGGLPVCRTDKRDKGRKYHHSHYICSLTYSLICSIELSFGRHFLGYIREECHANPNKIRFITRHITNKMNDKLGRADRIIRSIDRYMRLYPDCPNIPYFLDIRNGIKKCGLVKRIKYLVLNSGKYQSYESYLKETRIPNALSLIDKIGERAKELKKEARGA